MKKAEFEGYVYGENGSRGRGEVLCIVGGMIHGDWVGWGRVGKFRGDSLKINIFTAGLQGNYPTIMMVHPPVEYVYLKMCNFPQIPPFPLHLCIRVRL